MHTLKHIITAAMLLCTATAFAYDFEVNGIYYNIISDSEVEVTSGDNKYVGDIVIPEQVTHEGITYNVVAIRFYAFDVCKKLTSITLPESITEIGDGAFGSCYELTSINIPENVSRIGGGAFGYCMKLTSVTMPANISYIGGGAFDRTPFYENLPDGIVYFNKVLYSYKGEMPENTSISIKDGTVSISPNAFRYCSNLIAVNIPNTVKTIGKEAFCGCTGLKSVEIPNGVTIIEQEVFGSCSSLKTITIPESVTSLKGYAMINCSALEHIYNHAKTPAYCSEGVFENVPAETCVLHVPAGHIEAYQAADGWKDFANIVGDQAGIEDITTADAPAEYFDMRGMKVTDPTNGIFIKKQGNTTEKVLL